MTGHGGALVFTPVPERLSRWQPPETPRPLTLYVDPEAAPPDARPDAIESTVDLDWTLAPDLDAYALARFAVDDALDHLLAASPDFFRSILRGVDLAPGYATRLTYRYAYRYLPPLLTFLRQVEDRPEPVLLLDALVRPETARELFRTATGRAFAKEIELATSVRPDELAGLPRRYKRLMPASAPGDLESFRGCAAAFVGAARDLDFIEPLLAGVPSSQPLVLVLKTPSEELAARCVDVLSGRDRARVGTIRELGGHGYARRRLARAAAGVVRAIRRAHGGRRGAKPPRAPIDAHVPDVLALVRLALELDGFFRAYRPALVAGAFEKSAYGGLLPALQAAHEFKLVNFQHGIIPRGRVLDRMRFHRFIAWNEASVETVAADGYAPMSSVVVAGNPSWEKLRAATESEDSSPAALALDDWTGDAKLVVACTQPPNHVFLPARTCRAFLEIVARYVESQPRAKLLIKRHERDEGALDPPCLAALVEAGRARLAGYSDLSLAASLRRADVVTSISSTVLVDALAVGRPVVAVDLDRRLARIPYDLGDGGLVSTSETETHELLERVLLGDAPAPAPDPRLFPRFDGDYAARLASAIE